MNNTEPVEDWYRLIKIILGLYFSIILAFVIYIRCRWKSIEKEDQRKKKEIQDIYEGLRLLEEARRL